MFHNVVFLGRILPSSAFLLQLYTGLQIKVGARHRTYLERKSWKKKPLAKNQPSWANWLGDISNFYNWSHWSITMLMSPCQLTLTGWFWQVNISHLCLSGYANLSHNFTNLVFVTSSLLFSILRINKINCSHLSFTVFVKDTQYVDWVRHIFVSSDQNGDLAGHLSFQER